MSELVEVAVELPFESDNTYTYAVPEGWTVSVGMAVRVPLGQGTRAGVVIATGVSPPDALVKPLLAVRPGEVLPAELLSLVPWLAETCLASRWSALRAVRPVPTGQERTATAELWEAVRAGAELAAFAQSRRLRAPRQAELLEELGQRPWSLEEIRRAGLGPAWRALVAAGEIRSRGEVWAAPRPPKLQPAQAAAVAAVNPGETVLLHGVTGSGKTEVYLRAIEDSLAGGGGAVLLAPEIALSSQLVERVRERFGPTVAFWHSDLAAGERYRQWSRVRCGEARVVVGTRSAVFAPLSGPVLFVLDEEHDPSYKQEEAPRYQTREVATERAVRQGGAVLLGSATPSLESYHRSETGELRRLELPERLGGTLPPVELADLRPEPGGGSLGRRLKEALAETLGRREQSILFLNRRGYAPVLLCRDCGQTQRCPRCDVSLTLHRPDGRLHCHYCGYTRRPPDRCPNCGGRRWESLGAGTQRVEQEVSELFPQARILRLDRDAVRRRGEAGRIYRRFAAGEADILIGTQMVTKGFHFPAVTLVGVVAADASLQFPDFRAPERTFQLLSQVAGRAGRGDREGLVVIQTRQPEHPSLQAAARHDYRGFYQAEIPVRQELGYPPFGALLLLGFTGPDEERVKESATGLAERLGAASGVQLLGPAPALVRRVEDRYRWQIILKGKEARGLRETVRAGIAGWRPKGGVTLTVNPDPVTIL